MAAAVLAVLGIASGMRSLSAQIAPLDSLPRGEIIEQVTSRADTTQSYALYLPSGYTPDRTWPVLFVMDPRGRAPLALDLFQPAAERHGWVIFSSYDTRSDTTAELTERALDAMLVDAQDLIAVNRQRLYLAGFSGTARAAWSYAIPLQDHLAGIIGVGGGLPSETPFWEAALRELTAVAFFGSAGTADFNYDEMWKLDRQLDEAGVPHRVVFFSGPHSWFPQELATEAIEWMEIQAVRSGLRSPAEGWLDSMYTRSLEQAQDAEAAGDPVTALSRYQSLVRDFEELRDVSVAEAEQARLERSRSVRNAERQQQRLIRRADDYLGDLGSFFRRTRSADELPPLDRALARLRIEQLQREANDPDDPLRAAASQRLLESVFVNTSFYQPREYLREGNPSGALLMLQIAEGIKPQHPRVCYGFARAYAQLGQSDAAFEALACAADSGQLTAASIEQDPYLEPLAADPRFRELLNRLGGRRD